MKTALTLSCLLATSFASLQAAPSGEPLPPVAKDSTTAPPGCKLINTDKGYPTHDEFKATFPNIWTKEGMNRPDYHLPVQNVAQLQNAVQFATKHNIRLSILNSGHDFLGRSACFAKRSRCI